MITRTEFYTCFIILTAIVIFSIISVDTQILDIKRGKSKTQDSLLEVQRDSALHRALAAELKADSVQALLNRKNLDIQTIKKKTQDEKKNVLILNADSTLSYFLRTTGGN